jgi:hypothetical protein
MLKKFLGLAAFLVFISSGYAEESITITTYYPSPYGSYRELRSTRMAIGDNYISNASYSWDSGTIYSNADLVVEGSVGIGTAMPTDIVKLDVVGRMRIADGTQGPNYLLVSTSEGIASWKKGLQTMYFDVWCSLDGSVCISLTDLINSLNNPPQSTTIVNTSYQWVTGSWSEWVNVNDEDCYGRSCVWRYRTRSVTCVGDQSGTIVANSYCPGVQPSGYEYNCGSCCNTYPGHTACP